MGTPRFEEGVAKAKADGTDPGYVLDKGAQWAPIFQLVRIQWVGGKDTT